MKKRTSLFLIPILCAYLLTFTFTSCTTENTNDVEELNQNPIFGKWFLVEVNNTDVSNVECYQDSYLSSDGDTITFFLQDRLENGDCETVLNSSQPLTIEEDFYYVGDEALEIYIDGNTLSWRVDVETSLEFKK